MAQRNERAYYRCKVTHEKLYNEITHEMKRFFTRTMLEQLNHSRSTQHNEATNTSVAVLAQKGRNYSFTDSLRTRVRITGGCQILGHTAFWSLLFDAIDIEMDDGLKSFLQQRDTQERNKNIRHATIDGKRKRNTKKNVRNRSSSTATKQV